MGLGEFDYWSVTDNDPDGVKMGFFALTSHSGQPLYLYKDAVAITGGGIVWVKIQTRF